MIIWILFAICLVATIALIVTDNDEKNGSTLTDGEIAATITLYFTIVFLIVGVLLL